MILDANKKECEESVIVINGKANGASGKVSVGVHQR